MDHCTIDSTYSNNAEATEVYGQEGNSASGEGMLEVETAMETLNRVEMGLAYSYEKLVNLNVLLMHLFAWDIDLEAIAAEDSYISSPSSEKALAFYLLTGFLDSEVSEVENFMDNIQAEIVDAYHKISACRHMTKLFPSMEEKLHGFEELLKKSQEQALEVKMQSAKLQRAFSAFRGKDDKAMDISANGWLLNIKAKKQIAEQQRYTLRMLEKSLAKELDLEKKLSQLRQNEDQLKLKLHHTAQVAFRMEEAAEVVWGRFLEAENAAEVLMGISKELVGRLQIVQFNLNGSFQREAELKYRLQDCMQQLAVKEITEKNLENSVAEHVAKSSEVPALMEKVKSLEEQLRKSELSLKDANALNEESQEQLNEMENIIESLKETIYETENRAETAEAKVTQQTETNVELTEEINFIKGNRDSDTKKVSLLEKQVRDLEIQLQHAKASCEASQEQQNMLYTAIWDMETLIEDLKSKVSKAESKMESVEDQCVTLSETNFDLNEELSFLRSRLKTLESSLDQANNAKDESAKEINLKTTVIMDMVKELSTQRDRLQNQLFSLTNENKMLVEKLRDVKRDAFATGCNNGIGEKLLASENDVSNKACGNASDTAVSLSQSVQAGGDASAHETELGSSNYTTDNGTKMASRFAAERTGKGGLGNKINFVRASFVALFAAMVIYVLHKKPALFNNFMHSR